MKHDLTKLHPIHQQRYKEFQESPLTPDVLDELYLTWLDLNKTVPDIIGKQENELTNKQKERLAEKIEEMQPITIVKDTTSSDQ